MDFIATIIGILAALLLAWMLFSVLWPLIAAIFWIFAAGFASGGIFIVMLIIVVLIIVNQ
jgi:hypothetical protein